MACLLRKADSVVCVPRGDTAARQDGQASPDPDWLLAEGQPAECRRVRVRPLSTEEITGIEPGLAGIRKATEIGLVDVDGEACAIDGLIEQWQVAIGLLVLAVTSNPLIGRPFRWTASPSPDGSAPESSPA